MRYPFEPEKDPESESEWHWTLSDLVSSLLSLSHGFNWPALGQAPAGTGELMQQSKGSPGLEM